MGRKVIFKNGVSGVVSDSVYNVLLKKGEIRLDSFDPIESIKKHDAVKKEALKGVSVRPYESKDTFKQD